MGNWSRVGRLRASSVVETLEILETLDLNSNGSGGSRTSCLSLLRRYFESRRKLSGPMIFPDTDVLSCLFFHFANVPPATTNSPFYPWVSSTVYWWCRRPCVFFSRRLHDAPFAFPSCGSILPRKVTWPATWIQAQIDTV